MDFRAKVDGPVPPLPGRLADAVLNELASSEPSADRLAEIVRNYALESYARGVPPERMVVALKTVVADATESLDPRARAALVTSLIPFALEGYYLDPWMRRTGEISALPRGRAEGEHLGERSASDPRSTGSG